MNFLQRLGLLPEKKEVKKPIWITPEPLFEKSHKMNMGKPNETLLENLKEEKEQEDEFMKRMEKKRIVGSGNLKDMLDGYDRLRGKQGRKEVYIKEIPKREHYRFDMEKIVAEQEAKIKIEAGKKYVENTQEVLNHNK